MSRTVWRPDLLDPGRSRTFEHLFRPRTGPPGVDLFSIEPDCVQIVWGDIGARPLDVSVDDHRFRIEPPQRAGAHIIGGLEPDSPHVITVSSNCAVVSTRAFRTPPMPPGEELVRFATISDLHLGRGDLEYRGPVAYFGRSGGHDRPVDPRSVTHLTIARSAVDEALRWGAQRLVVKGDLCDQSFDWIWDQARDLLGDLIVPVSIVPGNHDTGALRRVEPQVAAAQRGLHMTRGVEHVDHQGIRLILVDSTVPGTSWGSLDRSTAAVSDLVADARRDTLGAFVATHHHPQRLAFPVFWPQGVPGPDALRFTRTVHRANPHVLASSGHTHRCRHRRVGGVDWSEVGATSQFPGVWAGYVVHEGGIRQLVRRIVDPDAISLIENGRDLLHGIWALWSTGEMSDRSFTLDWSN